jgi:hypothetical protein
MNRIDPIIEEIHAVRDDLARQAQYQIDQLLEDARARQRAGDRTVVRLAVTPSQPAKKAS